MKDNGRIKREGKRRRKRKEKKRKKKETSFLQAVIPGTLIPPGLRPTHSSTKTYSGGNPKLLEGRERERETLRRNLEWPSL